MWAIRPGDSPDEVVSSRRRRARRVHRPDLDVGDVRVITTGGDEFEAEREQWDDGNNVVAVEPGVVVAYERNTGTNTAAAARPASRSSPSRASSSAGVGAAPTA